MYDNGVGCGVMVTTGNGELVILWKRFVGLVIVRNRPVAFKVQGKG